MVVTRSTSIYSATPTEANQTSIGISVYRLIALLKSEQIMGIGCTYTRDINPETWLEYMKGEIDRILFRYGGTQDVTFHSKICLAHNDEKVDGNWQMRVGNLTWDMFVMVFCNRYNKGYTLTGLLNRLMSMEPKDFATYRDYCYEFESVCYRQPSRKFPGHTLAIDLLFEKLPTELWKKIPRTDDEKLDDAVIAISTNPYSSMSAKESVESFAVPALPLPSQASLCRCCGQSGHIARHCSQCAYCREDHNIKDCPYEGCWKSQVPKEKRRPLRPRQGSAKRPRTDSDL
ncbi:hypothetical protein IWW39_005806 [Coemansia spiralis]|uniref:CCHC-type domain-containing protein n=1 Tax=Coemansia spiralis TaxID=417178 RepID=A0A9W8GEH2_9FUNG|nr:hypothetical protein IWW39_005806 [Coemansia spiralis]